MWQGFAESLGARRGISVDPCEQCARVDAALALPKDGDDIATGRLCGGLKAKIQDIAVGLAAQWDCRCRPEKYTFPRLI